MYHIYMHKRIHVYVMNIFKHKEMILYAIFLTLTNKKESFERIKSECTEITPLDINFLERKSKNVHVRWR